MIFARRTIGWSSRYDEHKNAQLQPLLATIRQREIAGVNLNECPGLLDPIHFHGPEGRRRGFESRPVHHIM